MVAGITSGRFTKSLSTRGLKQSLSAVMLKLVKLNIARI